MAAASEIGALRVGLVTGEVAAGVAEELIRIPSPIELLSPIASIVPLQLLAYFSAVLRGRNPDGFRLEDARYKAASSRVQL
jgi:glucosamine 6-phosphate synthetase-like amidotransferase/phosphosugar isomerase protein